MLGAVPERSTSSEPPSRTRSEITPGTIAMAIAALSMAVFVYFMN